jgi:hypothetical protein
MQSLHSDALPPVFLSIYFVSAALPCATANRRPFVVVRFSLFSQIGILFVAVPVEVAVFAFAAIRAEALHESSSYPLAAFAVFLSVWTLQVWRPRAIKDEEIL